MNIIRKVISAIALSLAALVPLAVQAQAASQACLDSNVKAHAEVLASFQKATERTVFYPPLFTKEAFDRGVNWLSGAIRQHTLAMRTPNLTAAQCAYMTTYIEEVRKQVTAISQNQFIGVMTVGQPPAPPSLPPVATAANTEDPKLVVSRRQFEQIGKEVEAFMAQARAAGKITAYDETEFAALKKKVYDRAGEIGRAKGNLTAADYDSLNQELNAVGSVVYLMQHKTRTPDASGLDPEFYAYQYPDVRKALGTDPKKMNEHWESFGKKEARWPNKQTELLNAPGPRSGNGLSIMRLGDVLRSGEYMRSNNGQYVMIMQGDANLCIFGTGNPAAASGANHRWCLNKRSFEVGPQYKYYMRLQADGHACIYRGSSEADQGQGINCAPYGAGGPVGRYFLALQDDGNMAIYKGGGPADNRGYIWDRITTAPSRGFNFLAAVENVAGKVADTTVYAANSLANEVVKVANKSVKDIVNTANLVANTTETLAVQTGAQIEAGGKVVGAEIVKNGQIVGYAVANLATDAWNLLKGNCGTIGRRVFPIDSYFQGARRITGAMTTYGNIDPKNGPAVQAAANAANQCFEYVQDGFYCSFPKEIEKIVSQSAAIPGNMINLATRVFNEAKTEECLIIGASSAVFTGGAGIPMCGLARVVVNDAQKAFGCFSAANAKGVMKKFIPGGGGAVTNFPSQPLCNGMGELAFQVAKKVVTNAVSEQAKAAKAAGKSATVALVADELMTVYSGLGAIAQYNQVVGELENLPECK